jgi:hypothetical protein
LIEQENVKVTKAQLSNLIKLLETEKVIEFEEELNKLQPKPQEQNQTTPKDSKNSVK